MQTYAHDVLSIMSGVKVPSIINYSKITETPHDRINYVIEMEKMEGDDLLGFISKHVKSKRQLHEPGILDRLCEKINSATRIFKQKGFYHNDLNPGNIMVTGTLSNPNISIIDFGSASLKEDFNNPGYNNTYSNISMKNIEYTPRLLIDYLENSMPNRTPNRNSSRGNNFGTRSRRRGIKLTKCIRVKGKPRCGTMYNKFLKYRKNHKK